MRRTFSILCTVLLVSFLCVSCGKEAPPLSTDRAEASITVKNPSELVILAFTDIHLLNPKKKEDAGPLAEKTIRAISTLAEKQKPDLIVLNGDMFCSQEDEAPSIYLSEAMRKVGIPWAIVWGNHDMPGLSAFEKVLTKEALSLYKSCNTERNYSIKVKAGTEEKTLCRLFMMNSKTKGLTQKSSDWLSAELSHCPADGDALRMAFVHIPLPQFAELWDSGRATGQKRSEVSPGNTPANIFHELKKNGITAIFCGHDHNNDFYGEWEGVRLQYLKCHIKDGAYGQGATLIRISFPEKSCKTETLEYNAE